MSTHQTTKTRTKFRDVPLPRWSGRFQKPSRYKVAHGGRGSSKSWTFARMLVLRARDEPIRVLCARELQVSIKDSVFHLLVSQINRLGLQNHYDVGKSYIRSTCGAEFIFKGLRHNSDEIKSTEGVDICWVEEAQLVSEASWKLLIPTIRTGNHLGDNTEIWVSFNPVNHTDATYKRFVTNTPPDSIIAQVNFRDNPWFPAVLNAERKYMRKTDPDSYHHVWEGECMEISDAQVLNKKWIVDIFEPQPYWDGPYYGADWGFSQDPTALIKMWIHDNKLYIEYEAYGVGVEIDETPQLFMSVPDSSIHTITADSARPETISYMNRHGFIVKGAIKGAGSVIEGVKHLRTFEQIIIHPRCKKTAEEARLYSYKVDRLSGDILPVLVDKNNHLIDAARYGLEDVMRNKGDILIG